MAGGFGSSPGSILSSSCRGSFVRSFARSVLLRAPRHDAVTAASRVFRECHITRVMAMMFGTFGILFEMLF